jgi:thiol:disulfide interchange protein
MPHFATHHALRHKPHMIRALLALLLLIALPATAAPTAQTQHTKVELIAASRAPAAGKPITVALLMTPQPGWHTYWQNPGDAGVETRATWTLPKGATASALSYPTPGTYLTSGLMNYVYDRQNALLASVNIPAGLAKGTPFPLRLKLDWLVCDATLCVPETATLDLPLTIGDGAPDSATAARFAAARAALPKPVDWPAKFTVRGDRFILSVPFGNPAKVKTAYFFAATDGVIDYAAPQLVTATADSLRIETRASGKPPAKVSGVLKVSFVGNPAPQGFALTATPGNVGAAGAALPGERDSGSSWAAFAPALLLAIAGGLLLNVMPCVFPILSLKALALAKGHLPEAAARRDALAYTAGIMLVCTALGGVILGLRAAGSQIGWAFQLQDSRVILALLLLMTAIALNLAGLFEVNVSTGNAGHKLASKGGAAGSFWTGALAAFVATPCTGPFMAGALGAALVLPPVAGLMVFAGLGLGLALPFLALGFIPALRRRLPKPGPWMATMRQILSVPMFLTAVALAWVLGRQAGVGGMALGLLAALLLGLALWWLGARQRGGGSFALPLAGGLAAGIAALVMVGGMVPAATDSVTTDAPAGLAAQPFSADRLAALQASGKPAFVYFTADWCVTCKVNERGALANADVAAAFAKAGINVLVGDWTNGDAAISTFLESKGRSGVPLYLFYGRDGQVTELPQILTTGQLVALAA